MRFWEDNEVQLPAHFFRRGELRSPARTNEKARTKKVMNPFWRAFWCWCWEFSVASFHFATAFLYLCDNHHNAQKGCLYSQNYMKIVDALLNVWYYCYKVTTTDYCIITPNRTHLSLTIINGTPISVSP